MSNMTPPAISELLGDLEALTSLIKAGNYDTVDARLTTLSFDRTTDLLSRMQTAQASLTSTTTRLARAMANEAHTMTRRLAAK